MRNKSHSLSHTNIHMNIYSSEQYTIYVQHCTSCSKQHETYSLENRSVLLDECVFFPSFLYSLIAQHINPITGIVAKQVYVICMYVLNIFFLGGISFGIVVIVVLSIHQNIWVNKIFEPQSHKFEFHFGFSVFIQLKGPSQLPNLAETVVLYIANILCIHAHMVWFIQL